MKAAVYAGTRNLYPDMVTAAKSLAMHSSVDTIWFLIEDPVFPLPVPDYVRCLDVSQQLWFSKHGPNVYKLWTWMVLMRAVIPKIFPEYDKILSLDVDTIVNDNIDELWDLDLNGYYLAGALEPEKSKPNEPYINMGVVMFNNRMFIETKMVEKVILCLNRDHYRFPDQDCLNLLCKGQILTIPSDYNSNEYTEEISDPKIIHFAAIQKWNTNPIVQKYQNIPWDKVRS